MGGQRPELGTYRTPHSLVPSMQGTQYAVGAWQMFKNYSRRKLHLVRALS